VAPTAAQTNFVLNAPSSTRNSPTKPFVPGSPIDDSVTTRNTAENAGTAFHSPPKSTIARVWRRS